MNTRILIIVLSIVAAMVSWSGPAVADHPVKEIPIRVVRVQPHNATATLSDNVMRQVEFANRIYASAGIKFKFDPSAGFTNTWNADLNCWGDDIVDDVSEANYWADTNPQHMVVVVPRYEAPAADKACITPAPPDPPCAAHVDCCPDDWHYEHVGGFGFIQVCDAGVMCDGTSFECTRSYYKGGPTRCFGASCTPLSACESIPDGSIPGSTFLLFRPMFNDGIVKLAHEAGHLFGLGHPHDAPTDRCYDENQGEVPRNDECGLWPPTCTGAGAQPPKCPQTNIPWRNIMGYLDDCQARYAGEWDSLGWNLSLSMDQIEIIHKAIDTLFDPDVTGPGPTGYQFGGYEAMQVALASGSWEYWGQDAWSNPSGFYVGDGWWTKGNVKIKAADVNGDGRMDAIVSTNGYPYPGTSLWIRQENGLLAYSSTLWATGGTSMQVAVGNVTRDGCDDVVLTYNGLTIVYRGQYGASTMTYDTSKSWGTSNVKVYVGNFGGQHEMPVPMLAGQGLHLHEWVQERVDDPPHEYINISYDDVLAVLPTGTGSRLYYGDSQLSFAAPNVSDPSYTTSNVSGVWAVNMGGDYHDEMVVLSGTGLAVKKGADAFAFGNNYTTYSYNPLFTVRVSTGDLTGDSYYGDLLVTYYDGTKLYPGNPWGPGYQVYTRSDLTTNNTKHTTADFIRGGRDDVMFYTTSGSWLYAGARGSPYLTPNVWYSGSFTFSNAEWFGTQQ